MRAAYRNIDDQDRNVTQGTSSRSQVGKRLVPRSIDDKETRHLEFEGVVLKHTRQYRHYRIPGY